MTPLNGCGSCRSDFTSLKLFDGHRIGKHGFTYSEGVAMDPMREDGRRCLSVAEMTENGWVQDAKGRWFDPAAVEAARQAFARPQEALSALPRRLKQPLEALEAVTGPVTV